MNDNTRSEQSTKPRRGAGRPEGTTKLTPEIQAVIVDAIRVGNYVEAAAACAGIHKQTFYGWLHRGANAKEGDDIYRDFLDAVSRAMAESESVAVEAIRQAGEEHETIKTRTTSKPIYWNGKPILDDDGKPIYVEETVTEQFTETDWRALAWLLERRFSKRWGRREYLEATVTEKPIEEMTDNEIDAELSEILEKGNEG